MRTLCPTFARSKQILILGKKSMHLWNKAKTCVEKNVLNSCSSSHKLLFKRQIRFEQHFMTTWTTFNTPLCICLLRKHYVFRYSFCQFLHLTGYYLGDWPTVCLRDFQAFSFECIENITPNLACWCILTMMKKKRFWYVDFHNLGKIMNSNSALLGMPWNLVCCCSLIAFWID